MEKLHEFNKVRALRQTVGMKQYILAEKLGLDQSNYANMENGKLIPKNINSLKEKAFEILMPLLEKLIDEKEFEIGCYKALKSYCK